MEPTMTEETAADSERTTGEGAGGLRPRAGAARSGFHRPPPPANEPVLGYEPGSPERKLVKDRLDEMVDQEIEIPLIIGGEEVRTGETAELVIPHDHGTVLARYHQAGPEEARRAMNAALEAREEWASWSFEDRAAVFLKAAELLAGPWRATVNAATMLGQSKTVHQAEIDSACELIDFWRFNVHFAAQIYERQPDNAPGVWNQMDYRPLEGFIYAITPFNFTSIGGNLPTAPAIMGNASVWKPSRETVLAAHYIMKVLHEAGLPGGVVNCIVGPPAEISEPLLSSPDLAGIHFTGSTGTFQHLWKQVSDNLENYRSYPRIVGETGGKDFVVAHETSEPRALAVALVRGAFEYQGQKCSAVSRAYVPESLWSEVREDVVAMCEDIRMGDPRDFRNFMTAVIHERAFDDITSYIELARDSEDVELVTGGGYSDEEGWFIEPTVVRTDDPGHRLMKEEIFGPVLTVYVYPDEEWEETLRLCDETSPYGLTGAVFARDRGAIRQATAHLRNAAGNYYINDKPTGAVVGQQPFGGARASGTNDKAGSVLNLMRWVSPRAIKETLEPAKDYRYPFMEEK
jgi:1-pyrroline-5-carboxylate dehydrogenase